MADITVFVPVAPDPTPGSVQMAERAPLGDKPTIVLVENGKPRARDLMHYVAEELQSTWPDLEIDIYSKASAGKPLEGDEAKRIAARARLVLTGVGD